LNAKVSATKVCPGCSARYPPDALFCPNDGSPLSATPFASGSDASGGDLGASGEGRAEGLDTYLGREISGHIEIRKLAGVGAMGRVYRAFQKGIDRDVAVKVLHRELSANQQLVARFHREAKVASRLQHPNVVQVHLAGQLPDGAMYIVMEYLDGLSLQSALAAAGGPLPLERALHIALQICDAAGEAHSQGVIHRDIKPENVMLIRRGDDPDFVKVLDFGIARLNWGEQSMATAAGLIFGTARYISPEGAQGEAVGPEGDVYATATLLYQMLAGRTPFEGDQAVALLVQQIHDAPPPILSIPAAAGVPAAIAAVIMKNLSKIPGERSPDGRTFGRALVEAAKTVGLTPEDLVPRSSLFVPQARLSDPSPAHGPSSVSSIALAAESTRPLETSRDAAIPDFRALVAPQALLLPPQTKTQRWTPPPPKLEPARHSPSPPAAKLDAFPAPARGRGSSIDPTLDDSHPVHAPFRAPTPAPPDAAPANQRFRTEPAMPMAIATAVSPALVMHPQPSGPPGQAMVSPPAAHPPFGDQGIALDTTVDDERQNAGRASPSRASAKPPAKASRLVGVVILCFIIGMVGASAALYQLGMLGGGARAGSLDEAVTHADDALKHSRWDEPPGDNVRDITSQGLAKWPRDPRLLDVRAHATDELVKEAVGRKFAGDLPGALHLAKLANELDPSDTTAQSLVDAYERDTKTVPPTPSAHPSSAPTPVTPTAHGGAHGTPALAARASLEASLPHPKVGQPVTFTAKVLGATGVAKSIEEVRFVINGPGLTPDTKLGSIPGVAATFHATFTGIDPGKYDVTFDAKVDGLVAHATKSVVVEADAPVAPPTPPVAPPVSPPTVPSAKWL
jgi:serine/threonine protein kinase